MTLKACPLYKTILRNLLSATYHRLLDIFTPYFRDIMAYKMKCFLKLAFI
jgi:hypothetical protein